MKFFNRAVIFLFFLAHSFTFQSSRAATEPTPLRVTFIDVGQGDAILLRDGTGFDVLIDGGKKPGGETVLAYLRQIGVDDLEVMLATHADSDHIGGLVSVLQADDIPVESVLYNGLPGETQTWAEFVQAVADESLQLTAIGYPQSLAWGAATAQLLNPDPLIDYDDDNQASLVIHLTYGQVAWLFTADIDAAVETVLPGRGLPLQAELLKVAHHGSATASSSNFLAAVQPEQAVISVGHNPYGHPDPLVLERLAASGAGLWRTDMHGTLVVTSDGASYRIFNTRSLLPFLFNYHSAGD